MINLPKQWWKDVLKLKKEVSSLSRKAKGLTKADKVAILVLNVWIYQRNGSSQKLQNEDNPFRGN